MGTLLENCRATTSPDFCSEAALWNVEKCLAPGFQIFADRSQLQIAWPAAFSAAR
jgi:hypothetical protein